MEGAADVELSRSCSVAAQGQNARELARRYLRAVSGAWLSGPERCVFDCGLSPYWRDDLPLRPARDADAVSPHGGGGRGIHWYESAAALTGHIPGVKGGYVIPLPLAEPVTNGAVNSGHPVWHLENQRAAADD